MPKWPEGFKMAAIYNFSVEGEIVFIVRLRENIFIGITGKIN